MAYVAQQIGCPISINTDEGREEYPLARVSEEILANPDFEADFQSLILALGGKWEADAIQTFITNLKMRVRKAEAA